MQMPVNTEDSFQVTSVSWSCNGASLAVAYGKTDHVSWCEHQSILSIWNIFRRSFNPKEPNKTIEVPNCLVTVEFHPTDPLILAGGTINGEIFIWNIDIEESKDKGGPQIAKSEADEYFHREPIKRILWLSLDSAFSF